MEQQLDRLEKAQRSVVDAVQQFWRHHFDQVAHQAQESEQRLIAEIMRAERKELEKLEEIDQAFQAGLKKGGEIERARYTILLRALLASLIVGTMVTTGLLWYNWDRFCAHTINTKITTTHTSGGKL